MKSKSIQGNTSEDIRNELTRSTQDGFKPTLAFVFLSDVEDIKPIQKLMNENRIEVYGVSTSAQFTDKGIEISGISILLLDLDLNYFRVEIKNLEELSTLNASIQIAESGKKAFSNTGFIVSGVSLNTPGEEIINGIVQVAGNETTIIGGMGGEPVYFSGKVFNSSNIYERGIIALLINQNKIELNGVAVSGWKPVGTEKTITKCENGWIKTIDDKPAFQVLKRFMGEEFVTGEPYNSENIVRLNTIFPLQVKRKDGYPIMRPTLLANLEEQSVMCGGVVEEGNKFRFSIPPDFEVIDSVIESSSDIKNTSMPEADAMIIFSCEARRSNLGPMMEDELLGLSNNWGTPMAGFFCLGEFGKTIGGTRSEFHGSTCSWVALKEK